MSKKKELPTGIVNPFSEKFLDTWDLWKQYKYEEFKFKYKGCLSEQATLMKLNDISEGDEEIAIKIIRQSIENSWKGLFELPKVINNAATNNERRKDVSNALGGRSYQ